MRVNEATVGFGASGAIHNINSMSNSEKVERIALCIHENLGMRAGSHRRDIEGVVRHSTGTYGYGAAHTTTTTPSSPKLH